ncbi:hypothetical protein JJV70_19210 [Streptomyces sp. JJ66]|uniref:hypothetical protein n=1 Tax=Streptomyces sp. JJ66 TaxID=2803843 RepID=UPI001C571408|nr:hypothetical protein [Streptomyces sp. JJ66]MBW1604189.1 hypothetical protein [Streptomyces sp. JJ66]
MAVTLSLVLIFGLILFMLLRSRTLGAGSAFIAASFGFFLASTGAAGPINDFFTAVINAIPDI